MRLIEPREHLLERLLVGGICDIEARFLGGMRIDPRHDARRRGHRYERRLSVDGKTITLGLIGKRAGRALGVALKGVEAKIDTIDKRRVLCRLASVGSGKKRLGTSNSGQ